MRNFADPAHAIIVAFSRDGLISSISPGVELATGYAAQDLAGRPITHILADRSVFEVPQLMKSAREWGAWQGEITLRNRGGETLDVRGTVTHLTGRGNQCSGYLLVSGPLESTAGSTRDDALLFEIGAKLRMFSHELNNPLAVIMGFTQLILLNPCCSSDVRSDLEKVFPELKRVVQIVERLHTYAVSLQEGQEVEQPRKAVVTSIASRAG